jgi:hypothetical protein
MQSEQLSKRKFALCLSSDHSEYQAMIHSCIPNMRLDKLLANANDISLMVAQHLDAASLFRLSIASKDFQKIVNQSEVLYACVLRTFTGIRGVPKGRDSKYYWSVIRLYYSKNPNFLGRIIPHFELVTFIGISIKYDEPDSDEDVEGEDKVGMEIKVAGLLSDIRSQFGTLVGRRDIIKCVCDWKALVGDEDALTYRYDAEKLLDRISHLAKHSFRWHDGGELAWIRANEW